MIAPLSPSRQDLDELVQAAQLKARALADLQVFRLVSIALARAGHVIVYLSTVLYSTLRTQGT